jgi:hypothetical protein
MVLLYQGDHISGGGHGKRLPRPAAIGDAARGGFAFEAAEGRARPSLALALVRPPA